MLCHVYVYLYCMLMLLCWYSPPAAGSAMHRRLVAIGRAAAAYGKFQAARESLSAAGQWVELMPLCALQGDFDSLRDYAARVSGSQVTFWHHATDAQPSVQHDKLWPSL